MFDDRRYPPEERPDIPAPPPPPPPPHAPHEHGPHGPGRGPGPHIGREDYDALDTDGKLFVLIGELGHASRFLLDGKAGQSRALSLLREGETMTQRELTERLGIRPGSASELIGKLEKAGLITRTPSELDRRTADIALTEAGAAHRREREEARSGTAELFSALTEEEKTALLALLEKLRAAWGEIAPPPPPPHGPHHGPHGPHPHGPHGPRPEGPHPHELRPEEEVPE